MRRIRVIVRGMVQGVGFRYFTVRQAESLGLAGWVENLDDGSVQACAEGTEDAITTFLEALRQGPRFSRVEDLEILIDETRETPSETGFHVRR